ncbi:hypothetical protein BGZ98_003804 [Dissophora globulifera]|nr:hypothetical protein BGZ98_003804 [Dissophora globulifera]
MLGIESWTECREVKAKDGWKVEHCTSPGSTWMSSTGDMVETVDNTGRFLFRPNPRPAGQNYAYLAPPTAHAKAPTATSAQARNKSRLCNPSGYFRVQRLYTPSTDYTMGSDNKRVELRCRNNPDRPIALNDSTRDFVDNFAGPDTFRAVLDGPEHYVANQQINLGDCTYAIPYVLSRPGRFWLVQIEHGYEDFKALNENFDPTFVPNYLGDSILPEVGPAPPPQATKQAHRDYQKAVADVYEFMVCIGCPQFLLPADQPKYEDWPSCSLEPLKGAREYGVYARPRLVLSFQDLANSRQFEWVGARPHCRHSPRLSSFAAIEALQFSIPTHQETTVRPYGSPPPLTPPTVKQFTAEHTKTADCLSRPRSIYFAGDSHIRVLLSGVKNRMQGTDGDLANFKTYNTHVEQMGGVVIRQDFDQWIQGLQAKIKYMRDPSSYTPFSHHPEELDLLERFDTVVIDFGAWAAAGYNIGPLFTSVQYSEVMKELLWGLAEIRDQRRQYFKKTGFGYGDLSVLWMGTIPWPDTRLTPDMRTNTRLQYWDDLVNAEIGRINDHYRDQGGMIDTLDAFTKFLPHRKFSNDDSHFLAKAPADAIVQILVHKLDLCRATFTPVFPPAST